MIDDIDRKVELKIRILKHLKKKDWYAGLDKTYNNTSQKELFKKRGARWSHLSFRQFERIINELVGTKHIETFRVKRKKELYYKGTELGFKWIETEAKDIKASQKTQNDYIDELLQGIL